MNSYKCLGLLLTDRLDLTGTAKGVAQSANRALGLLIFKAMVEFHITRPGRKPGAY